MGHGFTGSAKRTAGGAALALVLALAGCADSGPEPRCRTGYLTGDAFTGGVSFVYVVGDPAYPYGGGWYDPGDDYVYGTPTDDGSGSASADDGSGTDDGSGDGTGGTGDNANGDTGGDSGWDGTNAVTKLRFASVAPRDAASAAATTATPALRTKADPNGCYTCRMGCTVEGTTTTTGRQAIGISDTSYDDACHSGVVIVEHWAHRNYHSKVKICEQVDATRARAPAMPTITGTKSGLTIGDRIRLPAPGPAIQD